MKLTCVAFLAFLSVSVFALKGDKDDAHELVRRGLKSSDCPYYGVGARSCCIGVPVCLANGMLKCYTISKAELPDGATCGCCPGFTPLPPAPIPAGFPVPSPTPPSGGATTPTVPRGGGFVPTAPSSGIIGGITITVKGGGTTPTVPAPPPNPAPVPFPAPVPKAPVPFPAPVPRPTAPSPTVPRGGGFVPTAPSSGIIGGITITVNGRPVAPTVPRGGQTSPTAPNPAPVQVPGLGPTSSTGTTNLPDYDGPCTYYGAPAYSVCRCIGVPVCQNGLTLCLTPRNAEKGIPSGATCGCCTGTFSNNREEVPPESSAFNLGAAVAMVIALIMV